MKKSCFSLIIILLMSIKCFSQNDSLDVFRTPSKKAGTGKNNELNLGNNALTLSIGHLGRGGSMLTYERYINNTPFSFLVGYGFTKIDYIGQYSILEEVFYYNNAYTERSRVDLGKMADIGAKYSFDEELGGSYLGFIFSYYENSIFQKIKADYETASSDSRLYRLNYTSNEFKLVYGAMNDVGERFYSDYFIGAGIRMFTYQQLQVYETTVPNNTNYYGYSIQLSVEKKTYSDFLPWVFFGWKIGMRF